MCWDLDFFFKFFLEYSSVRKIFQKQSDILTIHAQGSSGFVNLENNTRMHHKLTKYLKESVRLCRDIDFFFKFLFEYPSVRKISQK